MGIIKDTIKFIAYVLIDIASELRTGIGKRAVGAWKRLRGYCGKYAGKILVLLASFMWLLAFIQVTNSGKDVNEAQVANAFSKNYYSQVETEINVWGVVADNQKSAKAGRENTHGDAYMDTRNLLETVAKHMELNNYEVTGETLTQDSKNGSASIKVVDKNGLSYLTTNIKIKGGVDKGFSYEKLLKNVYKNLGIVCQSTVNFKGAVRGDLQQYEKEMLVNDLVDALQAKVVSQNQGDVYTVYLYKKSLEDYVKLGGRKININITATYDEKADITWINLATPINNYDF